MNKENYFVQLFAILLITLLVSLSLYWLPGLIWGYKLKKVDLLSDIRIKPESFSIDSLMKQLEEQDTVVFVAEEPDSLLAESKVDSTLLALRDSLYNTIYSMADADSSGTHIEDYSVGHVGLSHFFSALNKREELNRPVRIAFLGDSFIEGDIIVADLRSALQKEYGGNGVGFVPVKSVTDQFRPTINQYAQGFESFSMLQDTTHKYFLSGLFFEPHEDATLVINKSGKYPNSTDVSSLKLYYNSSRRNSILYVTEDTARFGLGAKHKPAVLEIPGHFNGGTLIFPEEGIRVYGTALEENEGIVVDNFSLRGNSGLILDRLDIELCHDFSEIRPYDLIILQYGLNVVSEEMLDYAWYKARMVKVVKHVRKCFPEADIMLMGVSDRAYQADNSFETMPAVLALLHAQRKIAQKAGITFWNTFGAMGGINSMVRYVDNNWAGKDYTHLSFRGGREIAKVLYGALLLEKEFYDEVEKSISE